MTFLKIKYLAVIYFFLFSFCLAGAKEVLSVLYFDNTAKNFDLDWVGKGLADLLTTDIDQSGDIIIVERQQLSKVLDEQKLALSGLADDRSAIEVGKLLNATKLITGSYIVQADQIRIDAKIIDTTSGKLEPVKVTGNISNLFEVEERLSDLIYDKLVLKRPENFEKETQSPDAFRSYYQGVSYLESGQTDRALESFRLSSEKDPFYVKPQKGLEEAYKFLKDFKKLRYQREISALYDKLSRFKARLEEKPFLTYADLLKKAEVQNMTASQMAEFNKSHETYILANTPAQCVWNMQATLLDIKTRQDNYQREEKITNKQNDELLQEIIRLAEKSRLIYKSDPNLPDILFVELIALRQQGDYARLKEYSEIFLTEYPNYRMIEGVEDYYKESLDKLNVTN